MSEHPPIPPNCQNFQIGTKGRVLFCYPICKGFFIQNSTMAWRSIIAAVARCGWLDEAKRVDSEWKEDAANVKSGNNKEGCAARFSNFNDGFQAAYDNAEKWRVWGER